MSPQEFVNSLNMREMPQFGYVMHEGRWRSPHYDFNNHKFSDFDKSTRERTATEIQAKRLGKLCFTPIGEQVISDSSYEACL